MSQADRHTISASGMTREDSLALVASVASRQRRNRPTHLVVLAIVVLVVGAGVAVAGRMSAGKADGLLKTARARESSIMVLVEQLEVLRAQQTGETEGSTSSGASFLISDLEKLAKDVGFSKVPDVPQVETSVYGQVTVRTIKYIRQTTGKPISEPLDTLMAWVDAALQRFDGMEVSLLTLEPVLKGANESITKSDPWKMEIWFSIKKVDRGS